MAHASATTDAGWVLRSRLAVDREYTVEYPLPRRLACGCAYLHLINRRSLIQVFRAVGKRGDGPLLIHCWPVIHSHVSVANAVHLMYGQTEESMRRVRWLVLLLGLL